ncbi:MAG: HD domain-containing protein [Abitibacteriaceae bacterium]|nr:HD domain-containing protein [Abditibacteriaceae bacterium]
MINTRSRMINATVQELRNFLIEGRKRLLRPTQASRLGRDWMQAHSDLIDETLRRIYHVAWDSARSSYIEAHGSNALHGSSLHPENEWGLALLAIGGYGRGELCPHSDIDIAFVPAEEENPLIDAVVKEAFRLIVEVLIDGARLDVGYAYRPIADCERLDHTGKTALLEARRLAGSEHLLRSMMDELYTTWDTVEFLLSKVHERRNVSQQLALSLYGVEPHLKEGAGALREAQTALWVAGAMLRTTAPLRELEWRGVVTADDCAQVIQARDFFLRVRVWLHLATQKKTDVLSIELQDRCARAFGYVGSGATAAQRLLADYYHHAEVSLRFSEKVMRRLIEGPLALDGHFVATHTRLGAAHPYTLRNHPELVVTPFVLSRKYGFATDPELDRAIEEAMPLMNAETRTHPIARAGFLALLRDPSEAADALTELRARGVLQKLIPEFHSMLHLAPADPSHQLSVGEHSIFAVRMLGQLWDQRQTQGEMHDVWEGVEDRELLLLATLLHDVGKIEAGTDHAVSGAQIMARIGQRLGLNPERTELLALLVRRHLLLPRVARLRDLAAPGTIREVIEYVHDVPTLKMLYLLALADTKAVGERTYSNLDIESMQELYERVLLAMTREETAEVLSDTEKREHLVQRERERLRHEMRHLALDEATLQRLTDELPTSYILNTPLPTVATHLKFLDQLPQEKVIVDFYTDPRRAFTEMTIVAYDDPKPGLLSKICGVVQAAGVDILEAQVYTLLAQEGEEQNLTDGPPNQNIERVDDISRNIVLDRLHIISNNRPITESRAARLAALLREVLLNEKTVESVLQATSKITAQGMVPQRIGARNDLSDEHTVISIVSDNVPGLLYHVTRALATIGLDIHTAKITSWAGRAEDAFYVTRRAPDGGSQKIDDDSIKGTLEALRQTLIKPAVSPTTNSSN